MNDESRNIHIWDRIRELRSAGYDDLEYTSRLESEVGRVTSLDEKVSLLSELSNELHRQNRDDEAEKAIKSRIAITSDLPDGWISLALHHLYYSGRLEESLEIVNVAIQKAQLDGNFLREAHIERIRIAIKMERFDIVQESILFLTVYHPPRGSVDSALDDDFLKRIPSETVDEVLLATYRKMASAEEEHRRKAPLT